MASRPAPLRNGKSIRDLGGRKSACTGQTLSYISQISGEGSALSRSGPRRAAKSKSGRSGREADYFRVQYTPRVAIPCARFAASRRASRSSRGSPLRRALKRYGDTEGRRLVPPERRFVNSRQQGRNAYPRCSCAPRHALIQCFLRALQSQEHTPLCVRTACP